MTPQHTSLERAGWFLLLVLLLVIFGFFAAAIFSVKDIFFPWHPSGELITFSIPAGAGAKQISRDLKTAGLIDSSFLFESYVWLARAETRFQAGAFEIPQEISLRVLTDNLTSGRSSEVMVTIPEGWTAKQIAERLEESEVVNKKDFLATVAQKQFTYSFQLPSGKFDLEGFLFPDTYQFAKETPAEKVIQRMLDNFDRRVSGDLREEINKQKLALFDAIRLASIVEKEVAQEEDRAKAAGIFWKRLKIGMPLQSDATLNYATGGTARALSVDELAIDSPYNTYKYRGLPPTPISNPGLEAIRAAIYPQDSPYLYFLSGADNKTYFAETFEEHVGNKQKYLKSN